MKKYLKQVQQHERVMEAETIQKNGTSPKRRMTREMMAVVMLLALYFFAFANQAIAQPLSGYYRAVHTNGSDITTISGLPDTKDVYGSITKLILTKQAGKVINSSGTTVYEFSGTLNNAPNQYWKFQKGTPRGSCTKDEAIAWVDMTYGYSGAVVIGNNGQVFANFYEIVNNYANVNTSASNVINNLEQGINNETGYTEAPGGAFVYNRMSTPQQYKQLTVTLLLTQAKIHYGNKTFTFNGKTYDLCKGNGYIYILTKASGFDWTGDTGLQIYRDDEDKGNVKIGVVIGGTTPSASRNIIPVNKVGDYYVPSFDVDMTVGYWKDGNGYPKFFMQITRKDTWKVIYEETLWFKESKVMFDNLRPEFMMATSFLWDWNNIGNGFNTGYSENKGSNGQDFTPAMDFSNGSYIKNMVWKEAKLHNNSTLTDLFFVAHKHN